MTTANEKQKIAPNILYPSLVQLVIHAETINWNRFYNFLMSNSILILAWATIYAQQLPDFATTVLVVISVLGLVSCIAAAALGWRGTGYLEKYVDLGVRIEADEECWGTNLADEYKLLTITEQYGKDASCCWARSRYLLRLGPVAFLIFYVFLLCVSITLWCRAAA